MKTDSYGERIPVVAGIVRDHDGRILVTRRHRDSHQGGRLEFPGGKMEALESPARALERELDEELGLRVERSRAFMTIDHDYPERSVRLHFREVIAFSGTPGGREGQPLDRVAPEQLDAREFPRANRPVVTALNLSDLLFVFPVDTISDWRVALSAAIRAGCGLVYLRGGNEPQTLRKMVAYCHDSNVRVLVAGDAELCRQVKADGLHLPSATARNLRQQPEVPLLSVACHDEQELARAERLQADLVLLSPVRETPSHPGGPCLGWRRLGQLAMGRPFSVYALGGVGPADLEQAREEGARGVAGIRAFMGPVALP